MYRDSIHLTVTALHAKAVKAVAGRDGGDGGCNATGGCV
jgi:hypothetical protein